MWKIDRSERKAEARQYGVPVQASAAVANRHTPNVAPIRNARRAMPESDCLCPGNRSAFTPGLAGGGMVEGVRIVASMDGSHVVWLLGRFTGHDMFGEPGPGDDAGTGVGAEPFRWSSSGSEGSAAGVGGRLLSMLGGLRAVMAADLISDGLTELDDFLSAGVNLSLNGEEGLY